MSGIVVGSVAAAVTTAATVVIGFDTLFNIVYMVFFP